MGTHDPAPRSEAVPNFREVDRPEQIRAIMGQSLRVGGNFEIQISERKLCDEIAFLARFPSYTILCLTSPSPAHLNCLRPARKPTRTFFFRDGRLENRAPVRVDTP